MALAVLFALSGCVDELPARDYGDPTQLDQVTTQGGLSIQLLEPEDIQRIEEPTIDLVVRAWLDDDESAELEVTAKPVGGQSTVATAEGPAGRERRYVVPVTLTHGRNIVEVSVQQVGGQARRVAKFPLTYVGEAPGLVVLQVGARADGPNCVDGTVPLTVGTDTACIAGRVSVADGTSLSRLQIDDASGGRTAEVDEFGRFQAIASVAPNTANTITLTAEDGAGRTTEQRVTIVQDSVPPVLTVDKPAAQQTITTAERFTIEGTVDNPDEIDTIEFVSPGGSTLIDTAANWTVDVPLGVGANPFEIVATDRAGNETRVARRIVRQRVHHLRPPPNERQSTILRLSRAALEELLDEEDQKDLLLAEIKIEPFLYGAINAIRNPIASGTDTSDWGPSQYNFFNLLNLSVDSASLEGTSLGPLADLSYAIGLPTARVLATVLDVGVTEPALTTDLIVETLLDDLVLTHPNAVVDEDGEAVLQITLYDSLQDLEPLAERFGPDPVSGHPGIIGGAIHAEVYEPGFLMSAKATSNLMQHEGVDASDATKAYLFILEGDQVLELDVFDDDTFSIVGLVDEPRVDITIAVRESPQFQRVGDQRQAGPIAGRPGFYRGNSEVWDLDPWTLEYIVADTVLRRFIDTYAAQNHHASYIFSAGSIEDAAEISWDKGWLVVQTAGNLGDPPDPQYVWDALSELAQVRLHDGGLAEGEANAVFDLNDVPVGIDSEQLIASLRPALNEQQDKLSDLLLGSSGVFESSADFYFVVGDNGQGTFLFFRHPADDGAPYHYDNPGFFGDAALSQRLSTTDALSGTSDTIHHKVAVSDGDVLYFEDDAGDRYKISIESVDETQLDVLVTPEASE